MRHAGWHFDRAIALTRHGTLGTLLWNTRSVCRGVAGRVRAEYAAVPKTAKKTYFSDENHPHEKFASMLQRNRWINLRIRNGERDEHGTLERCCEWHTTSD